MIDPDSRALARQHTEQLLKMLRGYGPVPEPFEPERTAAPLSTADLTLDAVTEGSPACVRLLDAPPQRMLPLERPNSTPTPLSSPHPHRHAVGEELWMNAMPGSILAVGKKLR